MADPLSVIVPALATVAAGAVAALSAWSTSRHPFRRLQAALDIRERLDDIEERFEWDEVVHTEIRRHQYDGQFQRWCRTAFVIGAIATLGGQFAASLSSGGTVAYVGQVFAVGGAVLLFGGALMYTFIRILVRKDEHFQSFKDFHETHAGNHPGE